MWKALWPGRHLLNALLQIHCGQQDDKSSQENRTELIDITADGDWYNYTALDMGWEFSKRIKLSLKDNLIVIEDLEI